MAYETPLTHKTGNTCRNGAPVSTILARLTAVTLAGWCIVDTMVANYDLTTKEATRISNHGIDLNITESSSSSHERVHS